MPQMSPLWWEMLFIIFVMTYLMFNIMIYFNQKNSLMNMNKMNKKTNNLNWTW